MRLTCYETDVPILATDGFFYVLDRPGDSRQAPISGKVFETIPHSERNSLSCENIKGSTGTGRVDIKLGYANLIGEKYLSAIGMRSEAFVCSISRETLLRYAPQVADLFPMIVPKVPAKVNFY